MQVSKEQVSPTKVKLTLKADAEMMQNVKDQTLRILGRDMKLPGFRPGKAPLPIIEKNANQAVLQQEFLEGANRSRAECRLRRCKPDRGIPRGEGVIR